jgi:hypothetical protein
MGRLLVIHTWLSEHFYARACFRSAPVRWPGPTSDAISTKLIRSGICRPLTRVIDVVNICLSRSEKYNASKLCFSSSTIVCCIQIRIDKSRGCVKVVIPVLTGRSVKNFVSFNQPRPRQTTLSLRLFILASSQIGGAACADSAAERCSVKLADEVPMMATEMPA